MSKIFKRPMFRKGGPTSGMNGIMTGIVDRTNHADDGGPVMDYIQKIIPTESEMSAFKERMPKPAERTGLDDPLTQFLLSYGPSLATAKPTGGIIGTAVGAAAEPTKQLFKDIREQKQLEYVTESDAFKTLLEAKADALSGIGDTQAKTYKDLMVGKEIEKLIPRISEIKRELQREDLEEADKIKLQNELEIAQTNLNRYRKSDPTGEALLEVFLKGPGQTFFLTTQERLLKENRGKYPKGETDPQLLEDTIKEIRRYLQQITDTRTGEKDGGRIGYQEGTPKPVMTEPSVQSEMGQPISYGQLRARLPNEITDDIVQLMSNSAEALTDFANIATQQDVDNFNKKFNVNLVLPAEA